LVESEPQQQIVTRTTVPSLISRAFWVKTEVVELGLESRLKVEIQLKWKEVAVEPWDGEGKEL
jgi:hypothetical protein